MGIRKLFLSTVVVITAATAVPASADNEQVLVAVNNGLAGTLAIEASGEGEDWNGEWDAGNPHYKIDADCTFNGVLTPDNTLIVNVYGTATSYADDPLRVQQLTYVKCEINNLAAGGTNVYDDANFMANGPHTTAVGSTVLTVDGPKEWPVLPITICTSGFALFGNEYPKFLRLKRTCRTPDGSAA